MDLDAVVLSDLQLFKSCVADGFSLKDLEDVLLRETVAAGGQAAPSEG